MAAQIHAIASEHFFICSSCPRHHSINLKMLMNTDTSATPSPTPETTPRPEGWPRALARTAQCHSRVSSRAIFCRTSRGQSSLGGTLVFPALR